MRVDVDRDYFFDIGQFELGHLASPALDFSFWKIDYTI
jgi:hypothetical protein